MVGETIRAATVLALLAGGATAGTAAGVDGSSFPVGRLVEAVTVVGDPDHSYSLYLPSNYSAQTQWPLLFVMDPRGRGTLAAEVFIAGAERYGYVLASSNDTRSDGEMLPNQRAINATLPDVARRVSIGPQSLYLAGMSGTSRVAWLAGHLMGETVAGVIGSAGATAGGEFEPGRKTRFAWYAVAANRDYNYLEMLEVHEELSRIGGASRLAFHAGGHSWPPTVLASQALGWLRLRAHRDGRRQMAPELVDALLAATRASAAAHEAAGRELDALLTYRGILEDFAGLRPTVNDAEAVARLERSAIAIRQRRERRRSARRETAYGPRIAAAIDRLRIESPPPTVELLLDVLEVPELISTRDRQAQSEAGLAAERMLTTLFTQMSFYVFRQLYAAEQWRRAEIGLEIASTIQPGDARVLYNLASVRARSGRIKKALEALDRAVGVGFDDLRLLESDDDLAALHRSPEYHRLVRRLGGEEPAAE